MQIATPGPVDDEGGAGGTGDEGQQGRKAGQRQTRSTRRHIVGDGRNDAGHVRGVALDREKASRIGRSSDEGKDGAQLAVDRAAAVRPGEPMQMRPLKKGAPGRPAVNKP